jgi:Icc protein
VLTIAQITDLHIASDNDPLSKARNSERLRCVLEAIQQRRPKPVAIFASGDLVDAGEPEEYSELKRLLKDVTIPIYFGVGNHDRRDVFRAAFPSTLVDDNGFVQYTVDFDGLRVIMCDTLEEGKHAGAFCSKRATWLAQRLSEGRQTPTIVMLHHPPITSGIQWMDEPPDRAWLLRLAETIDGWKQIRTLTCGHVHRAYHGIFAGQLVSVSPATSPQLTLDLTPVDLHAPDGREIVVDEPPGYTLFTWDKGELTTHICVAGTFASLASYETPFIQD